MNLIRNIQLLDEGFTVPCITVFATIVIEAILSASVISTVGCTFDTILL